MKIWYLNCREDVEPKVLGKVVPHNDQIFVEESFCTIEKPGLYIIVDKATNGIHFVVHITCKHITSLLKSRWEVY